MNPNAALSERDIQMLLEAVDSSSGRDAAIVSLLAHDGLKASEIINLAWNDLSHRDGVAILKIRGSRSRTIELSPTTNQILAGYRSICDKITHPTIAQMMKKRMFISFKGRVGIPQPKMTRHGLKFILYQIGGRVGISRLNSEQLRHYAMSRMVNLGLPPKRIRDHLGLRHIGNIAKHLPPKTENS